MTLSYLTLCTTSSLISTASEAGSSTVNCRWW